MLQAAAKTTGIRQACAALAMAKPPLQAAATTKTAGEKRFEAYYAQQHLVDDFPQLLEALRKQLPITFRIFDATRDGTGARRVEYAERDG